MSEEPFLAAIYAQPDDVGPRLAFADWLEDHGDKERRRTHFGGGR